MPNRFLFVNADAAGQAALQQVALRLERSCVVAATAEAAREQLRAESFDLCVIEMNLPEGGETIIQTAQACQPWTPVIALAGQGTVTEAVTAFRAGAADYLPRPFHPDLAVDIIRRVVHQSVSGNLGDETSGACLIGDHPAIRVVLDRIEQAADSGASVFIRGEEGTGQEIVARLIHTCSSRRAGPFVAVRPDSGQEGTGETFGTNETPDEVTASLGGTLFIDDVATLARDAQLGLLSLLKNPKGLDGAGGKDLRIIVATTQNMEQVVREGEFITELYYRLNVIPVTIPPLRDRPEDIPTLLDHFRRTANARRNRNVPPFSPEVLVKLGASSWPGNVRQVAETVDRLVATVKDRAVTVNDLPPGLRTDVVGLGPSLVDLPQDGLDLRLLLTQLEDRLIEQALQRTGGNKNRAAELLGMNRTTLVEKLRRKTG
jgi:two-component system, NtrC family, response regulator AtoC